MSAEIENKFNDILEKYQGTCMCLAEEDEDFLAEHDLHHRLDENMFMCAVCGWWGEACEQSEQEDDTVCQECYEDAQCG